MGSHSHHQASALRDVLSPGLASDYAGSLIHMHTLGIFHILRQDVSKHGCPPHPTWLLILHPRPSPTQAPSTPLWAQEDHLGFGPPVSLCTSCQSRHSAPQYFLFGPLMEFSVRSFYLPYLSKSVIRITFGMKFSWLVWSHQQQCLQPSVSSLCLINWGLIPHCDIHGLHNIALLALFDFAAHWFPHTPCVSRLDHGAPHTVAFFLCYFLSPVSTTASLQHLFHYTHFFVQIPP